VENHGCLAGHDASDHCQIIRAWKPLQQLLPGVAWQGQAAEDFHASSGGCWESTFEVMNLLLTEEEMPVMEKGSKRTRPTTWSEK